MAATIDEVARIADVSRASVYTYYASKRDLFIAVGAANSDTARLLGLVNRLRLPLDLDQAIELVRGLFAANKEIAGWAIAWNEASREDEEIRQAGLAYSLQVAKDFGVALAAFATREIEDPALFGLSILNQFEHIWYYENAYQDEEFEQRVQLEFARNMLAILTMPAQPDSCA